MKNSGECGCDVPSPLFNIDIRNRTGWTPAHVACYMGQQKVLSLLLDAGADVTKFARFDGAEDDATSRENHERPLQTFHNCIHLSCLCNFKRRDTLQTILARFGQESCHQLLRVPIQLKDPDETHLVVGGGTYSSIPPVEPAASQGTTALHLVVQDSCTECCRLLLRYEAPIDSMDEEGSTALHYSAMYGKEDIMESLLQYSGSSHSNWRNYKGDTPLHLACSSHFTAGVVMLLEYEASAELFNDVGLLPLHCCLNSPHCLDTLDVLLNAGTPVDATTEKQGNTALHLAAVQGYQPVAEYLLRHGAQVSRWNHSNRTPVWLARKWGHSFFARWLEVREEELAREHAESNRRQLHRGGGNNAVVGQAAAKGQNSLFGAMLSLRMEGSIQSLRNGGKGCNVTHEKEQLARHAKDWHEFEMNFDRIRNRRHHGSQTTCQWMPRNERKAMERVSGGGVGDTYYYTRPPPRSLPPLCNTHEWNAKLCYDVRPDMPQAVLTASARRTQMRRQMERISKRAPFCQVNILNHGKYQRQKPSRRGGEASLLQSRQPNHHLPSSSWDDDAAEEAGLKPRATSTSMSALVQTTGSAPHTLRCSASVVEISQITSTTTETLLLNTEDFPPLHFPKRQHNHPQLVQSIHPVFSMDLMFAVNDGTNTHGGQKMIAEGRSSGRHSGPNTKTEHRNDATVLQEEILTDNGHSSFSACTLTLQEPDRAIHIPTSSTSTVSSPQNLSFLSPVRETKPSLSQYDGI
jgi:ankyrin repeat protein